MREERTREMGLPKVFNKRFFFFFFFSKNCILTDFYHAEHVDAIARPYEENVDRMRKAMLKKVIRIGRDEGDGGISCSWEIVARTVDTTKSKTSRPT